MKKYRDHFFLKAKAENYPARSVYKLKEIDDRFKLLLPGMKILDLGCAPGSWSLGAIEKIGPQGLIIGCDLKPLEIDIPEQMKFFQTDINDPADEFIENLQKYGPFDLVMSDMAPATTGTRFTDQARSLELAQMAFENARTYLNSGGNFIVKIFMGPDIQELLEPMRKVFVKVKSFKPKSSRAESKETFFIGINFKGDKYVGT